MNYERLFQLLAVIFGAAAAFFFWRGQTEAMFVSGVVGAVCFFLSIRFQIKQRLDERAANSPQHEMDTSDE
jgi:hypothetical protein